MHKMNEQNSKVVKFLSLCFCKTSTRFILFIDTFNQVQNYHSYEESTLIPGQSVLGEVSSKMPSKVPAHASLFVKKSDLSVNNFLMVAGIDECSNSEVAVGPIGLLTTRPSK